MFLQIPYAHVCVYSLILTNQYSMWRMWKDLFFVTIITTFYVDNRVECVDNAVYAYEYTEIGNTKYGTAP